MKTNPASSTRGFNRYTRQPRNNWKRAKPNIRQGMTSTGKIINSKKEIKYGFTLENIGGRVKERSSIPSDMDSSPS